MTLISLVAGLTLGVAAVPAHAQPPSNRSAGLQIVVIEGEGAVNVIQQRTAVAPLVEVRDRNSQPVAGAVVRFAIQGGRASFNGARTLTLTTNAAGQAAATGLTPTGSGAFQITASATFQGQTSVVTLGQSNLATAAPPGAASGALGGAAAGVAAGGRRWGGLSAATIGIVSGAATGGALLAVKAIGAAADGGSTSSGRTTYAGSFTGQMLLTSNGISGGGSPYTCQSTRAISGVLTMELEEQNGTVRGAAVADASQPEISNTPTQFCVGSGGVSTPSWHFNAQVTGTPTTLVFTQQSLFSSGNTQTQTLTFSGALGGGVVSGTMTYSQTFVQASMPVAQLTESGSTTMSITLR